MKPIPPLTEPVKPKQKEPTSEPRPQNQGQQRCNFCTEPVDAHAKRCPHCTSWLVDFADSDQGSAATAAAISILSPAAGMAYRNHLPLCMAFAALDAFCFIGFFAAGSDARNVGIAFALGLRIIGSLTALAAPNGRRRFL